MTLRRWKTLARERVADMKIFTISRVTAVSPRTGQERNISLVETGDWTNVVALTDDGHVVLVRQYRHGNDEITLEIPGGLIDPGESPEDAAVRELREETGHTGRSVELLGHVQPNPAFLNNRCFTFLVEGCRETHELEQDDGEDLEVVRLPLDEIPGMIARQEISHALVICGFWWLAQKRPDLFSPDANGRPAPDLP